MTTYAVTGASGPFGHHAVESLLAGGVPAGDVVALVRSTAKAADLADRGVAVRPFDYDRPDTLAAALAGVDVLLLVSGSEVGRRVPQHRAVIDAAKSAGVGHLVYTSAPRADTTELAVAPEHKATEALIRDSGLPHTILRNGWYHENYTAHLADWLARGEIVGAAGDGVVSGSPRADYAEAAARAMTTAGEHANAIYELGGAPFTMKELAATITDVTGTTVTYRDVTPAELTGILTGAGLDEGTAGFVTALDVATARGDLEITTGDLARLLGRAPGTLADSIRAAV